MSSLDYKLQEDRNCFSYIPTGLPGTRTAPSMHRDETNIAERMN